MTIREILDRPAVETGEEINVDWREVEKLYRLRLEYNSSRPQPQPTALTIPNSFIRHNPLEYDDQVRVNALPEGVDRDSMVRVILRNGERSSYFARHYSWGDDEDINDTAIVAYRVIKVPKLWIDWGALHTRRSLETTPITTPVIPPHPALEGNPLVKVWLRDQRRPQRYAQHANQWFWGLNGTTNDIMKYRFLHEGEM